MKKYPSRRSSFYHLQMVFIVGMLARHPEIKVLVLDPDLYVT